MQDLDAIVSRALADFASAGDPALLENAKAKYLGKAGELTAFQSTLKSAPPAVYVYNNAVYDLTVRDSQVLGRTKVGARSFERLIRTEFAIRNRTTGEISRFDVTHVPDGAGSPLPVQIFYQPSFWLRVELRLDETAEVPADPAADGSVLTRIRAICAAAGR